ncbi:MAG TPA: o-succinylbenzoate synthase [Cryomorphaceae bacterium]|nr:o-succinylbenzoate synthase [Cryomorphaceae bacterium]
MDAKYCSHILKLKIPGGTSRGILTEKESFFIAIHNDGNIGLGEVGVLRGLSYDDVPELESQIAWTCKNIHLGLEELYAANVQFPSIQFAVEQAFSHLSNGFEHFSSSFTSGHSSQLINGLIWMGDFAFMRDQVSKRLSEGFTTLKMKVGAIDWHQEQSILTALRKEFTPDKLELRVDANGAFELEEAIEVSKFLVDHQVHSIEQPLPAGRDKELALAAERMHIPIALDESLIGVIDPKAKVYLLDTVKPQYIILKPSFIGGWRGADEWISIAESKGIGWWATSALESNVGLNAIAQWAFTKGNSIPQGLGTGSLFTNNIPGPYEVSGGTLKIARKVNEDWDLSAIKSIL